MERRKERKEPNKYGWLEEIGHYHAVIFAMVTYDAVNGGRVDIVGVQRHIFRRLRVIVGVVVR